MPLEMEKKKIESYKDLIVWQKGIELVDELMNALLTSLGNYIKK